ncbi:hypothetical protein L210DRAFT_3020621 [Boletus edulis BED1]|uniref:HNH nuclease domain-containing protein n=1 Tax=Boletus edulis BED1 TaxID=1328754 RepID=A0AAD4BHT3_BOLED|nr:hypothetical protein L210DRAFT_3020621 [Boletus edulis BED1]
MVPLPRFKLPLNGPPCGFGWEECGIPAPSPSRFKIGVHGRDTILGRPRCVICGLSGEMVKHCFILKGKSSYYWNRLKDSNWISSQIRNTCMEEPHTGLLLCSNHHVLFDKYYFFIRYFPEVHKFVFVNYSSQPDQQQFHGKAIALDIKDHLTPYPSLFVLHEMRVRGYHPQQPLDPDVPDNISCQDWISDGVIKR